MLNNKLGPNKISEDIVDKRFAEYDPNIRFILGNDLFSDKEIENIVNSIEKEE